MANLKDIADKLGISVSTVSRALNDSDEISTEMKDKIHTTAEAMGYTLRGRGGKVTPEWNAAGIIVPEVTSEHYAKIVHMAKELFAAKGYSTIVKVTNYVTAEMVEAIHNMARIRVKCLLVALDDDEITSQRVVRTIQHSHLPVLLITPKYSPLLDFDCIHLDEYAGFLLGIQHLQERGATKIGFLGESVNLTRPATFRQAMDLQRLPVGSGCVRVGADRNEQGGYLRMRELLRLEPSERPDAVFCSTDQMAIGALHALREQGLRVPEDMRIIGYDDCSAAPFVDGGITTIANPYDDMLSIAVNVLTRREHHRDSSHQQIALRPTLVIRATT